MGRKNKGKADPREPGEKAQTVATISMEMKEKISSFLLDDDAHSLTFPSTLSNIERKAIHQYAGTIGLKTKSMGKEPNRYITLSKKTKKPVQRKDCSSLELSSGTSDKIEYLLRCYPLKNETSCQLIARNHPNERTSLPFNFTIGPNNGNRRKFVVPEMPKNGGPFRDTRESLPIFPYRQEILDVIAANQVVVISGETGSGKTTQVPQYILEDCASKKTGCRIICTQPRRLAATSIADRVSQERNDSLGRSVGYQIRLDSCVSSQTNLIFTTSGYLLRCLMGGKSGELFESVTHLVLDEVHEREKITDFLLIAIKDALHCHPNLKVILMSATMDSEIFCKYFFDCSVINVPGRMFSVDLIHLGEVLCTTGYTTKLMDHYMHETKAPKMVKKVAKDETVRQKPVSGVKIPNEAYNVPPDDAEFYDECLEECLSSSTDAPFEQIFYLITSENMPVDYLHGERLLSALMIAASKGLVTVVEQLLMLGANAELTGAEGLNAAAFAIRSGKTECIHLLSEHQPMDEASAEDIAQTAASEEYEKAKHRYHANAYLLTTAKDEVDRNLLLSVIKHVHATKPHDGSILVFLPGYDDIMAEKDLIEAEILTQDYQIFVLHSGMQGTNQGDQKKVFEKLPTGFRKIILSTNIAETSLTIDDVVYVIDAGKVKQTTYDSLSETTCLTSTWISQACAKQRAGRAGRTRHGICYRLYSIDHFETMEKYTLPEILRVPLTDICLNAKILAQENTIEEFLLKALQPPPVLSIRQSINLLKRIDALDKDENITDLGIYLADLPVDAQLGKCLLYAIMLKCLDPVVTIISALSVKDPFILPMGQDRDQIETIKAQFANGRFSDHMMLLNAFEEWQKRRSYNQERHFSYKNFISNANMEMIHGVRSLILRHLQSVGLVNDKSSQNKRHLNENSNSWPIIKACLTAGFYPNICRIDAAKGKLFSKQDRKLLPHASSVLRKKNNQLDPDLKRSGVEWLVHGEKSKVSYFSLVRNISAVAAINIALFTGPINLPESNLQNIITGEPDSDSDDEWNDGVVEMEGRQLAYFSTDDWISFIMGRRDAELVFRLRQKFNGILVKMLQSPTRFNPTNADQNIISTMVQVLEMEESVTKAPDFGAQFGSAPNALESSSYLNAINDFGRPGFRQSNGPNGSFHSSASRGGNSNQKAQAKKMDAMVKKREEKKEKRNVKRRAQMAMAAAEPRVAQIHQFVSPEIPYVPPPVSIDIVMNALHNTFNRSNLNGRSEAHCSTSQQPEENSMSTQNHNAGIEDNGQSSNRNGFLKRNAFAVNCSPTSKHSKYFLLTIPSLKNLMATMFSGKWNFGMSLESLKKAEQNQPDANIFIFFYVKEKNGIYGGAQFQSWNNSYRMFSVSKSNRMPTKCIKQMKVDFDHEMDAKSGQILLDLCRDW